MEICYLENENEVEGLH